MTDQQPHTPITQTVERTYVTYGRVDGPLHPEERRAEFFRWLTAHDESIRAEEREDIEAAAEQRGAERAEQAIYELTEAIRFTVEYVGNDTLPPIDGWSWFDALRKYRPELAEHFEQNPQLSPDNYVTREIIADQIKDRAVQIANKEESE